jgi:hypothetical protein
MQDSDLVAVVVSGLRVADLFYVDMLFAPRPYLEVSLDGLVFYTPWDREGTECAWPEEEFEFQLNRHSLSYKELTVTLMYVPAPPLSFVPLSFPLYYLLFAHKKESHFH